MKRDIKSLRGRVAFGIITIREDEAEAVLNRFEAQDTARGRADYDVGIVRTLDGSDHQFALIRCPSTGQGTAQRTAHDLIEDLAPSLILLVGIGGAVPSKDFTLGDVVCATRVHDFCVVAALENRPNELDSRGGPMHRRIEVLLGRLPAIVRKASFKGWNSHTSIGPVLPSISAPPAGSDRYYGSDNWQKDVRESLEYHFPTGTKHRSRLVTARPIASSDALVKDTDLVQHWRKAARAVAAVEMELAGIYIAARGDPEVPVLAVRGISDIVGFRRGEEWTKFACDSAAAFAYAFVKSGELDHLFPSVTASLSEPLVGQSLEAAPSAAGPKSALSNIPDRNPFVRRVSVVALTPDGRRAVSGSNDGTLRLWDLESGQTIRTLQGHRGSVNGVAITLDGRRAISASEDKTLQVWDLESGQSIATLQGHSAWVSSVAITLDGGRAVSGSWDCTLRLWDLESGQTIRTLQGHDGWVNGVEIAMDGRRAVSASEDNTLRVWDLESGQSIAVLQDHSGGVNDVAITPDGGRAVSASNDTTLLVWDLRTGKSILALQGHTSAARAVAVTPDGRRAVSASDDRTLRLWDLESGQSIAILQDHSDGVNDVAITPDGSRAISASGDQTLRLWDLERWTRVLMPDAHADVDVSHAATTGNGFGNSVDEIKRFQTFIVPTAVDECAYDMEGIQLKLRRYNGSDQSDLVVELYETVNDHPSGSPLTEVSVSSSRIDTGWSIVTVPLYYRCDGRSHGIVPGKKYAVALSQWRPHRACYEWAVGNVSSSLQFGKWNNSSWIDESGLGNGWLKVSLIKHIGPS